MKTPSSGAEIANQNASPAASAIANGIAQILFTTEDKLADSRTAQAKAIFEGLQKGTIDRSLFTSNANSYFSDQALKDFQSSLGPLGAPTGFVETRTALRGGMTIGTMESRVRSRRSECGRTRCRTESLNSTRRHQRLRPLGSARSAVYPVGGRHGTNCG